MRGLRRSLSYSVPIWYKQPAFFLIADPTMPGIAAPTEPGDAADKLSPVFTFTQEKTSKYSDQSGNFDV